MFSRGIEKEKWHEMGSCLNTSWKKLLQNFFQYKYAQVISQLYFSKDVFIINEKFVFSIYVDLVCMYCRIIFSLYFFR